MTTAVVDPVLQPITLANAPVREKAEDFGGAAPRDAEDDFKVGADKTQGRVNDANSKTRGGQRERGHTGRKGAYIFFAFRPPSFLVGCSLTLFSLTSSVDISLGVGR